MNSRKLSINRSDGWLLLLSVFVPPVPVLIRKGFFSRDFLLNVLLFVILFIPAIAHAAYVIIETSDERNKDYEPVPVPSQDDEEGPGNGDFDVDLESNALPLYDDVVASSEQPTDAPTDNKIQK
ncbi:Sna3p TDEL_0H00770 [Torulaspora delbrueckii]|uniref:Stress response RCI peptide n=1 Tax=Torulaspora delbrueckii TaxID=4950 RepID=G8ZZ92_TORDE|nr:hypothetical protein TDEL_0H00770 [Torulaspora delbrueckii]CCE93936.1 hypothetical protein TDEL_0H00770 [Torulaspora delbrueckii]